MSSLGTGFFFTWHNSLEIHPACCTDHWFLLFIAEEVFSRVSVPQFDEGHLGSFQFWASMKKATMNIFVHMCMCVCEHSFHFFRDKRLRVQSLDCVIITCLIL